MDDHLSIKQIAERLSVHRVTVYRLVRDGFFPNAFRVGTDWRIPAGDVNAYIDGQRQTAGVAR